MNHTTVQELQSRLSRYLSGAITLQEFRAWFDEGTWGLAAEDDSPTREMAGEIELRMAEFTNGHLTEAELRTQLETLLPVLDFQLPITERLVEMTLL